MNSGRLINFSSIKIVILVSFIHALFLFYFVSKQRSITLESTPVFYSQLREAKSFVNHKSVKQNAANLQRTGNYLNSESAHREQDTLTSQQPMINNHFSQVAISLPSASHPSLSNPKPPYPITSRENGEEGRVWLSLCVSEQGLISDLQLAQSSGYPALDRSAMRTVSHWKFIPAKQNGFAIPYCYRLPIVFVLG